MTILAPLRVLPPGFYGLNTQQNTTPDLQWSSEATNMVVDAKGRMAARKGRYDLTSPAVSGTPDMRTVYEQSRSDGTLTVISAGGNKLFSGTTTLTDITGTAGSVTGITADDWQLQNIGDYLVGFQEGHDPIVRTTGNFSLLQQSISAWASGTAYAVGDVVRSTAGNQTKYFHCTTSGTSGGGEPSWNTTVGATTTDNTAVWTCRKMPNGNVCHSAFGRLWVVSSGDASVVEYSDLLIPYKFRGGSAGTLDLKSVWGGDTLVAIGSHENMVIFFGTRNIVIYSGADDPSAMALVENLKGVGCVARDTVQSTGKDALFLSSSGVRFLSRALTSGRQPLGDLTVNVRDQFTSDISQEAPEDIKSVYSERDGFYALFLLGADVAWVLDMRYPNPDGSAKVTYWTGMNVHSAYAAADSTLYLGGAGKVAKYHGYVDGSAGTYVARYASTWVDFGALDPSGRMGVPARVKIPKSMRVYALTNAAYRITYNWAFDYAEYGYTSASALVRETGVSEWGEAEWGVGVWSGGEAFSSSRVHPQSHGQVMKIGMAVTINGSPIAFQELLLAAKLGKQAF